MHMILSCLDDHVQAPVVQFFVQINGALLPNAQSKFGIFPVQFAHRAGQKVRTDGRQRSEPVTSRNVPDRLAGNSFDILNLCQENTGSAHNFFADGRENFTRPGTFDQRRA
jgi:hypothetical protein